MLLWSVTFKEGGWGVWRGLLYIAHSCRIGNDISRFALPLPIVDYSRTSNVIFFGLRFQGRRRNFHTQIEETSEAFYLFFSLRGNTALAHPRSPLCHSECVNLACKCKKKSTAATSKTGMKNNRAAGSTLISKNVTNYGHVLTQTNY